MKHCLSALLALCIGCGLASAQFLPGVTATSGMGTFSTYKIVNLTNGSGLSSMTLAGTHSNVWQDMWISNAVKTGWVEFDLGSIQLVRTIAMWNYNSSISLGRGVAMMDVYTSLDGSKYVLLGRETPPRGTTQPLPAHLIQVNMPARFVKFDILQNHGDATYTGMSEVQFVVGPCSGGITAAGIGCKDSGGTPNTLTSSGCPDRGALLTLRMNVSTTTAGPLLLVAGLSDKNWGAIPLPLDLGPLGAPGCFHHISQTLLLGPFTPVGGQAAFGLPIPQGAHLLGAKVFFQFFNIELGLNPVQISSSDYLTAVIG